jgi:UDP-4-amino-4,6-dideoxy-N-acetyl-beta-L-altrosamine N-acetyltransferase
VIELVECAEKHRWLLLEWRNSDAVARFMFQADPIPADVHDAWYTRLLERRERQGWLISMDGTPVGAGFISGLRREHRRADFGLYLADSSARGRGVGAAAVYLLSRHAFEHMALHKLSCEALSFNTGAIATYSKAGFEEEGVLREHIRRDGRWVDVHVFAMLEDEWLRRGPVVAGTLKERGLVA